MTNLKRIILPIFSDSVAELLFERAAGNPGCGGTQFVTIILGIRLAEMLPNVQIELLNHKAFGIENIPSNLRIVTIPHRDASAYLRASEVGSVAIVPTALLKRLGFSGSDLSNTKIIGWIHHPFSLSRRIKRMVLTAHVSVGQAQYFSNFPFFQRHWHIPNLFNTSARNVGAGKKSVDYAAPVFVFLGAMVPAKGLHHILDNWVAILERFPNATLHVIGGSSTYGLESTHPLLPCSDKYGNRLLRNLPPPEVGKSVIFHGNLGAEKNEIIQKAHIALLNPTGRSEAFPASPLECLALGTPVVASADFGMQDVMRHFPEATLRSPRDIVRVVTEILAEPELYCALRTRGRALAAYYEGRSDDIAQTWIRLIKKSLNGNVDNLPPVTSYSLRSAGLRRVRQAVARLRNWRS